MAEPRPAHRTRRVVPRARERTARTCTSAPCLRLRGPGARLRRLRRAASSARLHLVPRYRQQLAFPPLGAGAPGVGRRPALQRPLPRPPHRAAGARRRRAAAQRSPAACSPSSSTATSRCGRSGSSTTSSGGRFALICKTHHALVDGISGVDIMTVLFDLEPDPPEPRAAAPPWSRGPQPSARRSCSPTRWPSARRAPLGARPRPRSARSRDPRAAPARGPRRGRARRDGCAPGCAARRRARSTCAIGPHRRFAWVDGDLAAVQGDQGRARRHGQRRRAHRRHRRAARATCSAAGATPRASSSRRWCRSPCAPTPSAARSATAWRRCTRRCRSALRDPVERFGFVHAAMSGLKESGQAVGARGDHPARRLRRADRARPGGAAAVAPALLQPHGDQRARARSSRSTCSGARLRGVLPEGAARRSTPRSASRSCPTTGTLFFGLLGDYDALADLDALAADLRDAIAELAAAAGVARRRRAPLRRVAALRRGGSSSRA